MPSSLLAPVELSSDERAQLESWSRRRTSAQSLALRSRIVLLAADGLKNTQIAGELGVHRNMVAKWRSRFLEHRLDGLTDEPRPGRPRTVTDEQVGHVVVKTLESTPKHATHWSTRSMAREVGLTQSAVQRIWKAFGLQPHRQDTWKLSKDPLFIDTGSTSSSAGSQNSPPSCCAAARIALSASSTATFAPGSTPEPMTQAARPDKTADQILDSIARYCERINESRHLS
jgi:transposase